MSKKCGDCKWFNKIVGIHCTWHEIEMHPNEEACGDFEPPTVFDHITQSVEKLAEKLVYQRPDGWWVATIVYDGAKFTHKETAIAATVAELKREWKKDDSGRN
jgi:hypothetical protein